jgi:drug/metabolite transporter (DMT)-like permease
MAHFALPDEHITPNKVMGLVLGFAGVLVLVLRPDETVDANNSLLGALAIIFASLSYAGATVFTRRTLIGRLEPIVIAAGSFIPATLTAMVMMLIEPALGGPGAIDIFALEPVVWGSAIMLGLLNTFVAYLFFYYIVEQLGAFRASNVTYVVPVVAIFLGWVFLNEVPDLRFGIGALLIFAGIAVINVPLRALVRRARARAAA